TATAGRATTRVVSARPLETNNPCGQGKHGQGITELIARPLVRRGPTMLKRSLFLRVAGPTIFVSLCLLGLGLAAAVYLYRQQATSLGDLDENVDSRRVAHELQEALSALSTALVQQRWAKVAALHSQLDELLDEARELTDKPEEKRLMAQLEAGFSGYLSIWHDREPPEHVLSAREVRQAVALLQEKSLPACRQLRSFNAGQIEKSEAALRRTMKGIAWGLAAVGGIISIAGVLLGYGVASAL